MSTSTTNATHSIPFYGGVVGLTISNFSIDIFTVDGNTVDTSTRASLVIQPIGFTGYYLAQYTPTIPGFYCLAIFNAAHTIRVINGVDIDQALSYVNLTQDTGGVGALVPSNISDIEQYLLMVFLSTDWQVGRTDPSYAVASTGLDNQGNWLSTPLIIQHGTYNVVVQNNSGIIVVIKAFLEV